MSARYRLLPLVQHLEYIAEREPNAIRFQEAVRQAFEQIAMHPYSGPCHNAVKPAAFGLRVKLVPRFRSYRVFYRVLGARSVEVVRILHTARDLPQVLQEPV